MKGRGNGAGEGIGKRRGGWAIANAHGKIVEADKQAIRAVTPALWPLYHSMSQRVSHYHGCFIRVRPFPSRVRSGGAWRVEGGVPRVEPRELPLYPQHRFEGDERLAAHEERSGVRRGHVS